MDDNSHGSMYYLKAPKYQNAHPGNSDPRLEQVFLVNVLNVTDQTSSLRFIEVNWNLGFIDGATLPPGQPLGSFSFDQLAGSILNMFDFDDRPNTGTLILDPLTGTARR